MEEEGAGVWSVGGTPGPLRREKTPRRGLDAGGRGPGTVKTQMRLK